MAENIIELHNVSKEFQLNSSSKGLGHFQNFNLGRTKKKIKALDNISFTVEKGEILGIIGLNGSGKTTLLQTIAGLYTPDVGNIKIHASSQLWRMPTEIRPITNSTKYSSAWGGSPTHPASASKTPRS